jgi:hypothetical protein
VLEYDHDLVANFWQQISATLTARHGYCYTSPPGFIGFHQPRQLNLHLIALRALVIDDNSNMQATHFASALRGVADFFWKLHLLS